MKVNSLKEKDREKVFLLDMTEASTLVLLYKDNNMERESFYGLMEELIKVDGKKVKCMEKVKRPGQMINLTKEIT